MICSSIEYLTIKHCTIKQTRRCGIILYVRVQESVNWSTYHCINVDQWIACTRSCNHWYCTENHPHWSIDMCPNLEYCMLKRVVSGFQIGRQWDSDMGVFLCCERVRPYDDGTKYVTCTLIFISSCRFHINHIWRRRCTRARLPRYTWWISAKVSSRDTTQLDLRMDGNNTQNTRKNEKRVISRSFSNS